MRIIRSFRIHFSDREMTHVEIALPICYNAINLHGTGKDMKDFDTALFFDQRPEAFPIYQALEERILDDIRDVHVKVQKSQIAFTNRHNFAFVSFLPVRRAKERPKVYITVSFGLSCQKTSPRIDAATEPYPNRWTHHVLVSSIDEIDDELLG